VYTAILAVHSVSTGLESTTVDPQESHSFPEQWLEVRWDTLVCFK